MGFCVMVKGPCRGEMCDFWARIKIRKITLEELSLGIQRSMTMCHSKNTSSLDDAMKDYWHQLGIRNMQRLSEEEPDLYEKMKQAEKLARGHLTK